MQSLLALWLFERFELPLSTAGVFFFWSGVLSALSFPVAAWLSRHIGLVNTMVFTHIPASLCLILAALSPTLPVALVLLLIRAALSQMDVPTRSSYVMAVVTEAERPAAASFASVPRSLAAAASPALAGALFAASLGAWPLIMICGALKISYDLLLLMQFRHLKRAGRTLTRTCPHLLWPAKFAASRLPVTGAVLTATAASPLLVSAVRRPPGIARENLKLGTRYHCRRSSSVDPRICSTTREYNHLCRTSRAAACPRRCRSAGASMRRTNSGKRLRITRPKSRPRRS